MSTLAPTRRAALALFGLAACAAVAGVPRTSNAAALPGDSLYQLHAVLVDQDGRPFALDSLRGQLVLASMFYTSCEMVCPVIFETIRHTVATLRPEVRERVHVLMVSFDPARDSAAVLKDTAARHGCDARWHLVRSTEAEARRIAAVLGVQYRRLPSGEFNHSSAVALLDGDGRIVARSGAMGELDPAFIAAIGRH